MNHIAQYTDKQLQEMQEICTYISQSFVGDSVKMMGDIYKIALIEINRELDERKLR